jgi:hypothetical protein
MRPIALMGGSLLHHLRRQYASAANRLAPVGMVLFSSQFLDCIDRGQERATTLESESQFPFEWLDFERTILPYSIESKLDD